MNPYIQNLNRIEFMITLACTGRCKHCSEGGETRRKPDGHIDARLATEVVCRLCGRFDIQSLMTFGGEPLLHTDVVCEIHSAARDMKVPQRQIITNGYFSEDERRVREAAKQLSESGVNAVLLSVDAFHQETIPLEPVKWFAEEIVRTGVWLRTNPAWLVGQGDENPYNRRTEEILREFEQMGIRQSEGNIIFPSGNARKYLSEYFASDQEYKNPYDEDPRDIRAICISPNGDVLGGNLYETDILELIENYAPDGADQSENRGDVYDAKVLSGI